MQREGDRDERYRTSGQLDYVPSPAEGLRAPGLATGPIQSTEKRKVTSSRDMIQGLHMENDNHTYVGYYK